MAVSGVSVTNGQPGSDDEAGWCERPDCIQIATTASEVYDDITGGRLSKPTWDSRTILADANEHIQRIVDEDVAAETAELRGELAVARAKLAAVEELAQHIVSIHVLHSDYYESLYANVTTCAGCCTPEDDYPCVELRMAWAALGGPQ